MPTLFCKKIINTNCYLEKSEFIKNKGNRTENRQNQNREDDEAQLSP